ncbi:MAG: HEAT repeat domain-containing protein [Desulfobacteraceae bacterium]|nr:MAG: HEAT repeat domain-containing protein [Desulfobacteraceae bacterium]
MDKTAIQKTIMDLIIVMNAAITNIRLYPPTSALIVNSVERMYNVIQSLLPQVDCVEFAESEKSLLVQGDPLSEKDQKKPQVVSFLSLMLDAGIRSISIEKGLTKDEVNRFLQIIGKSADEINTTGGIRQLFTDQNITHFKIGEQLYVKTDSERSLVSGMDIKDKDIVKFLLGDQAFSEEAVDQIRKSLKDPELISQVFQEGIRHLVDGGASEAKLSESVGEMLDKLKEASGASKEDIAQFILNSLADMPEDVLLTVLTRNIEQTFGEKVFKEFLETLDNEKFERLILKVENIEKTVSADPQFTAPQLESIRHIFKLMKTSSKGRGLTDDQAMQDGDPSDAQKQKIEKLKLALSSILKGETSEFPKISGLDGLAEVVEKLAEKGKNFTVDAILERLGEGLLNNDPEIRTAAATLLAKIDEKFESTDFLEQRIRLSQKLSAWIKFETDISPVYQKITSQLQNLSQSLIENGRAEDAGHILEAYNQIYTGNLTKDEAIKALSANLLQNLATEDVLDLLLKDTRADGSNKKKEDIYSLILLGTTTVERLLDRLHDSHNRSERNRIVQIVTKIGESAIQPVIERIRQDGPWFYIRNLTLLLGRIGTTSHLNILEPILTHSDPRVQREAVFAIQNIGGEDIGKIFLENLYSVEDELRILLISVLGLLKYQDAVPSLLEMLDSKTPGKTKKTKNAILEKACEALGRIGDKAAIPALENIRQPKGFLSLKTHDPNVVEAAKEALAQIKK